MKLNLDYTVYKGHQTGKIVKSQGHRDDLAPDEVLLKITHAGLCGTDEHYKSVDMVLGHEGVGIVQQVGEQANTFKVYVPFPEWAAEPLCSHIASAEIALAGGTCTIVACTVTSV